MPVYSIVSNSVLSSQYTWNADLAHQGVHKCAVHIQEASVVALLGGLLCRRHVLRALRDVFDGAVDPLKIRMRDGMIACTVSRTSMLTTWLRPSSSSPNGSPR